MITTTYGLRNGVGEEEASEMIKELDACAPHMVYTVFTVGVAHLLNNGH